MGESTSAIVTPWAVLGQIDYKKLVEQFGTEIIDEKLLDKFREITGKEPHQWIKRGIFFSHRGLNDFLDAYARGDPVFLYTGRGPSGDMHVGHMVPFMFTKYLQDVFDCYIVVQIADDEKYYFKDIEFDKIYKLGFENARDIIAFGFNPEKTFIFSNRDYRMCTKEYEIFASKVQKNIGVKVIQKIFGLTENDNVGMHMWPIYQSIAAFSKSYPHLFTKPAFCLVAYAIDQDPYFRLARDIAGTMHLPKPCSIISTFLDPLTGSGKMSSSGGTNMTLFLTDCEKTLRKKINRYAFSGGGGSGTYEDHKKYGGNPDVDISCKYLRYFELDDDILTDTLSKFRSGEYSCSDLKKMMADKLVPIVLNHQENRKLVNDDIVNIFYAKKS